MGTWNETKEHARRTLMSLTGSRAQTATAIGALALPALFSPVAAVASVAAAGALLFARSRATRQPFAAAAGKVGSRHEETYPIGTMEDGTPVAFSAQQMGSGMLVYGTTGSGRTEALLGIAEGMIAKGSGMIFIDGIGDVSLYAKVASMAAALGREDDVLVIMPAYDGTPRGHAFNPFEFGTSRQLATLIGDLLDPSGSDSALKPRAIALVRPVLEALVRRRDTGISALDLDALLAALSFENAHALLDDEGLPDAVKDDLRSYVKMVPGYQPERGAKQSLHTLEQHGYVESYISSVLRHLKQAAILSSSIPQVDMVDVMRNDRILVVLVPSLDRSELESSICSRAVVATLRMAMTSMLEMRATGDGAITTARRTKTFPIFLNDVGFIASRALGRIATSAYSLGFSMIYGAPDERSLTRRFVETGHDLIANASITIRLHPDGDGRMTTSVKGVSRDLVAIYPRTLGATLTTSSSADCLRLEPSDLIPLTGRLAN